MANEQKKGPGAELIKMVSAALFAELVKEAPELAEKGAHWLAGLFHKHKHDIIKAAIPVTAQDLPPCPQGYHRDAHGECVLDIG